MSPNATKEDKDNHSNQKNRTTMPTTNHADTMAKTIMQTNMVSEKFDREKYDQEHMKLKTKQTRR